jgi:hypothetical protein
MNHHEEGCVIAQAVAAGFPSRQPGFKPASGHVGFVVDMVMGQVFSKYFGLPCQAFHWLLHTHHPIIRGWYNKPNSNLSSTPPQAKKKTIRTNITSQCTLNQVHWYHWQQTVTFYTSFVPPQLEKVAFCILHPFTYFIIEKFKYYRNSV